MMMERKQSISNRATTPPSLPVVRHSNPKVADNVPFTARNCPTPRLGSKYWARTATLAPEPDV